MWRSLQVGPQARNLTCLGALRGGILALQARSNVENEGAKPAAAVVRRIVAATHTLVAELAHGSFGTLDLAQEVRPSTRGCPSTLFAVDVPMYVQRCKSTAASPFLKLLKRAFMGF